MSQVYGFEVGVGGKDMPFCRIASCYLTFPFTFNYTAETSVSKIAIRL